MKLILILPTWYFGSAFLMPFNAGLISTIPKLGVAALVLALILSIWARARSLLLYGLLALASHVYIGVAFLFSGAIQDSGSVVLWIFPILTVLLASYLVYKIKSARWPAFLLGVFTSSYAVSAAFIAAMALTDRWL